MLISVTNPEVLPFINEMPIGAMPLACSDGKTWKFIIKAPKEALLAAKINKGFGIYITPIETERGELLAFSSAFYDDLDEPIFIKTICFERDELQVMRGLLLSEGFNVHLFNEIGQEMLAYRANVKMHDAVRILISNFDSPAYGVITDLEFMMAAYSRLNELIASRDDVQDRAALRVDFLNPLFDESSVIYDLRTERLSQHGKGSGLVQLERDEPGAIQEWEIIQLLARVFPKEQIYANPLKVSDGQEMVDVMVVSKDVVLLLQAKDRQNRKDVLQQKIVRKKKAASQALSKACRQMKGAFKYAKSNDLFVVNVNGKSLNISMEGRTLVGLIVLQEMFDDEYADYSQMLFALSDDVRTPVIALDYSELNQYTSKLRGHDAFFSAYWRVYNFARERGGYPRLRIW